jgi:hypothetical protein
MLTEFALDPRLTTAATPPANGTRTWHAGAREETAGPAYACSLDPLRPPGNFAAVDVAGTPVVLTAAGMVR